MLSKNGILVLFSLLLIGGLCISQEKNEAYQEIVNRCSFDTIHKNLLKFEDLGIKGVKTYALEKTANWLIDKYKEFGYEQIERDTFYYSNDTLFNLVINKTGAKYPEKFLIIDGHYDTKNGPGVGDNGSGTVILLEIARLLANVETDYSIRFIHFSGEEDGLIGSSHYVNKFVQQQDPNVVLVFNIDAVGGVNGSINNTVVCERDEDNSPSTNNAESAQITSLLSTYMKLYSSLSTKISNAYASDYMPFENKGVVITGLYEANESPYAHTSNDNLSHVDENYIFEVAKGAIASALHFSEYTESTTGLKENKLDKNAVSVYCDTSSEQLKITFKKYESSQITVKIFDLSGKLYMKQLFANSSQANILNISKLQKGYYLYSIKTGKKIYNGKFVK